MTEAAVEIEPTLLLDSDNTILVNEMIVFAAATIDKAEGYDLIVLAARGELPGELAQINLAFTKEMAEKVIAQMRETLDEEPVE